MNVTFLKIKTLGPILMLVLVAINIKAEIDTLVFTDCANDTWYLQNVEIRAYNSGLTVEANAAHGSNFSDQANKVVFTVPYCYNASECENKTISRVESTVPCDSANITAGTKKVCDLAKSVAESRKLMAQILDHFNTTVTEGCFKYMETEIDLGGMFYDSSEENDFNSSEDSSENNSTLDSSQEE